MAPVPRRLLRPRDDLMESDPTPPELQKSGAAVAGAILGIILVGLAMIAMVMTLFWKCRVARWKRLERQHAAHDADFFPGGRGDRKGDAQKPLPSVPASQVLASVPSAHAGATGPGSQPWGSHHYYA